MKQQSPFIQKFAELPISLRLFPLSKAVVLPGTHLPLNIFEPRYLNMVRDAIRSDQLIGMIQPKQSEPSEELFKVGCAGRITSYEEKPDGRIELVLTGVCRFAIKEELSATRGYRMASVDWSNFSSDYEEYQTPAASDVVTFKAHLRSYLNRHQISADWAVLDALAIDDLANSLLSYLPLSVEDKQIILEAKTFPERLVIFSAIIDEASDPGVTH